MPHGNPELPLLFPIAAIIAICTAVYATAFAAIYSTIYIMCIVICSTGISLPGQGEDFSEIPANPLCQFLIYLSWVDAADIATAKAACIRLKIMLYLVPNADILSQLHLQKLQIRVGKNSMLSAGRQLHHIPRLDILHFPINHGTPVT